MSGPPQQLRDLGVACVVVLHRFSVRGDRPAEQQPFGGDRLRCAHLHRVRSSNGARFAESTPRTRPPPARRLCDAAEHIGIDRSIRLHRRSALRASNRPAPRARPRGSAQPSPQDGRDGNGARVSPIVTSDNPVAPRPWKPGRSAADLALRSDEGRREIVGRGGVWTHDVGTWDGPGRWVRFGSVGSAAPLWSLDGV